MSLCSLLESPSTRRAYLRLSGTRAINGSGQSIKDGYDGDADREQRYDDRNQDCCSEDHGKGVEDHAEGVCENKFREDDSSRPRERTGQ